ncbi:MAG: serine/threonine protein kinase [Anaerolineae bacterium]|nr:serine/threonine protein kinase [Anaerolineae bacterium]
MASDNLTGQLLGQYELRELLGVGGMGSVYRGFQTALKREVAIKVLPSTLAQQTGYMERFTREAETAAALEHPHIVPIVDYGTQRGISYVVMRLLTGGTLADRISHTQAEGRGLPSLGETAKLLRELGSALDYAHNRGVIHRDIKTSNVMFDNQGNAYLVDFGIAKLMHATNKLTGTGVAVGTPTYMAPEQWAGEEVFPATDQYSLAVLAYITVTGREPFEASTPFQLLNKHLHEMPTPLTVIRGDLPPALDLVLARALAKDPKARFQSCTAFAQAFESAIEGNKGSETNFFVFKVPPKKQTPFAPPPAGTPPQCVPTANMYPTPLPTPKRNTGLLLGMGVIILALVGVIIALIASGGGGDTDKSDTPTDTSVPAVVILASDEPIITPPNMTATSEIIITMTGIAEQMIATQSAVPEILPTDVPATRTAFPSFTPIIPTNTPLPSLTPIIPTNTALPSFTPIIPTNTPLPSFTPVPPTTTPVPPTDIPLSTITLTINGLGVWVKESPESDGRRLGTLISITVEVLGISADGEWYAVPYQDGIGWVAKSSNIELNGFESRLEVIEVQAVNDPITITVNGLGVWVKESPEADGRRLGSFINITVEVLGISADGEWYAVPYQDGIGWVQKSSNAILNGDESQLVVITP